MTSILKLVVLVKYLQIKFSFLLLIYFLDIRVKRLAIGETQLLASEIYSSVEEDHAAPLVVINNYCKWTLGNAEYRIYAGTTYDQPSFIFAGYTEAFSVIQEDFKQYIEGLVSWKLTNDHYCLLYFKVGAKLQWRRESNNIGIGCSNYTASTYSQVLHEIPEWASKGRDNELIKFQRFDSGSLSTLQQCTDDICVQITAGSDHQIRTSVYVIPKHISHVAPSIQSEVSQSDLDFIIIDESDCLLSCDDSTTPDPSQSYLNLTSGKVLAIALGVPFGIIGLVVVCALLACTIKLCICACEK